MAKKTAMTPKAAKRIQSATDRQAASGDQGFKARAAKAAQVNSGATQASKPKS